jgi:hypothetical protein
VVVRQFQTGDNISIISALSLDWAQVPMRIEGTIGGRESKPIFTFSRPAGDIDIWDNVPTIKAQTFSF